MKHRIAILIILSILLFTSCSRKHLPQEDSITANKPIIKKKPRLPPPKVIVVNDKVARKTVDGRLFYDLEGYRYWRNYNDGKYYLFNKSMYSNAAFKPH